MRSGGMEGVGRPEQIPTDVPLADVEPLSQEREDELGGQLSQGETERRIVGGKVVAALREDDAARIVHMAVKMQDVHGAVRRPTQALVQGRPGEPQGP